MTEQGSKPKYKPIPPAHGQWKPGQSGNPKGRPPSRPFKDSFDRIIKLMDPVGDGAAALDKLNAAMYARAVNGDVSAYKELADRYEGKIPQSIGGSNELPPIAGFAWLDVLAEPKLVEGPVLEGSGSEIPTSPDPEQAGSATEPAQTDNNTDSK